MLFRSRNTPSLAQRIRSSLWPRSGWSRASRYVMRRVSRLKATPYAIGMGFAAGAFVSFLPFMGLHFVMGGIIAWAFRASIIASAFGTVVGNPLTFPFIWIATYETGNWILGEKATRAGIDLSEGIFANSIDKLWPLIKPMTVGGIPLGLVAGAVCYIIVKRLAEAYQEKRRRDDNIEPGPDKRAARA